MCIGICVNKRRRRLERSRSVVPHAGVRISSIPTAVHSRMQILENDKVYAKILDKSVVIPYDPGINVYPQRICIICLKDFADKEAVRVLGCRHIFHKECIETWIKSRLNTRVI